MSKVVLITGAARGIGLATAKRFLAEGWSVALLDIEAALLEATYSGLCEPERTLQLICDVSDPAQVTAAFAKMEKHFGSLDALVNNAGIAVFKSIFYDNWLSWLSRFYWCDRQYCHFDYDHEWCF